MFVKVKMNVAVIGSSVNARKPTIQGAMKISPHFASVRASRERGRRRGSVMTVMRRPRGRALPVRQAGPPLFDLGVERLLEVALHLVDLGVHIETRRPGELREVLHEHVE